MDSQDTLFAILPAVLYLILIAVAAAEDIRRERIPNALNLALAALYPATAHLTGEHAIAWHLACGGIVLTAGLATARKGWLGAGDAKFIAAVSCWTGFGLLAAFLAATALAGGLVALLFLALRPNRRQGSIPFGPAIAIGALAVLPFLDVARFDLLSALIG